VAEREAGGRQLQAVERVVGETQLAAVEWEAAVGGGFAAESGVKVAVLV
jgi:hypothetical protein